VSRSQPCGALDHSSDDSAVEWPNIEFDGGDEAKSLPPELAW
jgi:hypothetical protein